jgi:DNA-directed RNA polymerase specialized sigma24 family protein
MPAIREEEYAAVAERELPLIQATAYLLTGDLVRAEQVVQRVLAELYGRLPRVRHPRVEALRAVVQVAHWPVQLPWQSRKRVELIDGPAPAAEPPPAEAPAVEPPAAEPPAAEPIVADLGALSYDERVVVVLDSYAELPSMQIAEVLERPVDEVLLLARKARTALAVGHPRRTNEEVLAQELRDAIPYAMRESHASATDLAHGRQLRYRRWIQRGSAALVAVVLIVVVAAVLIPTRPPVPQSAPPRPTPTAPTVNCEPSSATCQAQILFRWRSRMTEVARSHLDPGGEYFSGFGYFYDSRYNTPSFWSGGGGALAFQMFRLDKGATEVYLQVATSRKFAVRCGATTHQKCLSFRFMDGNSYLMTDSTLRRRGIEVQYSPNGDEVITVIARNTQRGQILDISRGDLIKLVQDERIHLPKRCCYRR